MLRTKPPLLGEVARRSRDGGVSGLCNAVILCFFPGLEAHLRAATPQALRASSPSSGAKSSSTRKGMVIHTQLRLPLAEKPKIASSARGW